MTKWNGPSGINLSDALTMDAREFSPSMLGVFGISSPDSYAVGTVRFLSTNNRIMDTRGNLSKTNENPETIDSTSLLTPTEYMSPYVYNAADGPRIGMNTTQSKHIIPTKEQSVPLISTGMERAVKHTVSSDFIFTAKEDGQVLDVNNEAKIATIKYKSGKIAYVDFETRMAKNSNGGLTKFF